MLIKGISGCKGSALFEVHFADLMRVEGASVSFAFAKVEKFVKRGK